MAAWFGLHAALCVCSSIIEQYVGYWGHTGCKRSTFLGWQLAIAGGGTPGLC